MRNVQRLERKLVHSSEWKQWTTVMTVEDIVWTYGENHSCTK